MSIMLVGINHENWEECVNLKLDQGQEQYVASNVFSLAQAAYLKTDTYSFIPLAIYNDDQMVGFLLWDQIPLGDTGIYFIQRFMIDRRYQRKGYGKSGMKEIIKLIVSQKPDCKVISLTIKPDNVAAQRLYESVGFHKTDKIHNGEVVMHYSVESMPAIND